MCHFLEVCWSQRVGHFFFKNGGVAFFFIIRLGYDFDRENVVLDKTFPNDFCFTSKDPFPDWPGLSFFSSTRPITNLAASCNLLPTRALDHDRKGYKFQQDIEDTFMTCWIFWGEGNVICLAFFFFGFLSFCCFVHELGWHRVSWQSVTFGRLGTKNENLVDETWHTRPSTSFSGASGRHRGRGRVYTHTREKENDNG